MASGTASAQAPTPPPPAPGAAGVSDDRVNAIAKQLYCPVCENIPLDVCPTQACIQWRELIREKLALGWDEQQIKDYFALQYGDRVLAAPPRRGLNWLVYVLPPLTLLAGGVILYLALRRRPRPAARPSSPSRTAGTPSYGSSPADQRPAAQGADSVQPAKARDTQGSNRNGSDEYLRRIDEELRKREQ